MTITTALPICIGNPHLTHQCFLKEQLMFLCLLKNKVVHCIWKGKTQINTNNFHADMKKRSVERKKMGRGFMSFTGLSLDFSTQTYGNLTIIFFLRASTTLLNTMNNHHQLIMQSMINIEDIYGKPSKKRVSIKKQSLFTWTPSLLPLIRK